MEPEFPPAAATGEEDGVEPVVRVVGLYHVEGEGTGEVVATVLTSPSGVAA